MINGYIEETIMTRDTIMVKCLDSENTYKSYSNYGSNRRQSDMSKNKLFSTASQELACDLNSSLKYDCNRGE
jgi:hypothetical protein